MDPPRPEAKRAIAECQAAGIAVKMITGDHRDTGVAIARELGLQGNALTGAELDRMDAHALSAAVDGTAVFARVTPQHKVMIVQALQAKNHVVAMTGDGVNDAPALKAADIGIAMGVGGTEARVESGSTFTRGFFRNRMLWLSLTVVVGMQALAEHWPPAQTVFGITDLSAAQWAVAVGVASSVLVLEELRKAVQRLFSKPGSASEVARPVAQA